MNMVIKNSLKEISFIYNIYRTVRKLTVDRPLSQKKILRKVLRYNTERFIHYSGTYKDSKGKDTAYITWLYHVIEKGLAMRDMRPGFGQEKVKELCELVQEYGKKYGCDNVTYQASVAVIKEYIHVNKELNVRFDKEISECLGFFKNVNPQISLRGEYSKETFYAFKGEEFPLFAHSRHSVRNFEPDKEIEIETLVKAINLAQTAPSACNRQPVKVHIISNFDMIKQCLALQNGNRGFGNLANKLLIVTGNLQTILGAQEFFDLNTNVGIFIMNLCYSLHYYQIGHCVLNWYALPEVDRKLRKIVNIADEENIVAFIVCGYVPENFKVAVSPRIDVDDIIEIH